MLFGLNLLYSSLLQRVLYCFQQQRKGPEQNKGINLDSNLTLIYIKV